MKNEQYVFQMVSLSEKAGKCADGEFQCEDALRNGKAKIVFVSADASENTQKKFENKCFFYQVPFYQLSIGKERLGTIIGKSDRSVIALTDKGLSEAILKKGIS